MELSSLREPKPGASRRDRPGADAFRNRQYPAQMAEAAVRSAFARADAPN
jgi:hypothetical protein